MSDDTGLDFVSAGAVVAELRLEASTGAKAIASDGEWWFSRRRGTAIDAGREGNDRVIARYRPRAWGGAALKVADGPSYVLRPPLIGERYKLRRGRKTVAEFKRDAVFNLRLRDAANDEPNLWLVLLLAVYALWTEAWSPAIPAAPT